MDQLSGQFVLTGQDRTGLFCRKSVKLCEEVTTRIVWSFQWLKKSSSERAIRRLNLLIYSSTSATSVTTWCIKRDKNCTECITNILEVDRSLQLNDRAQQQLSDDLGDGPDATTTALVIRRVARRLCVLENLGVPAHAQQAVLRNEFPTLTADMRQSFVTLARTIITTVREQIRVAQPYMQCRLFGQAAERLPAEGRLITSTLSPTSSAQQSAPNQRAPTQFEEEVPAPPSQLSDVDGNNNEPDSEDQHINMPELNLAVQTTGDTRIAVKKFIRKKRTTQRRSTANDAPTLLSPPQQRRQQQKEKVNAHTSSVHAERTSSAVSVRRRAVMRSSVAISATGAVKGATATQDRAPIREPAARRRRISTSKERHRVLRTPPRPEERKYGDMDRSPRRDSSVKSRTRSVSSGARSTTARSRTRSPPQRTQQHHARDQPARDWRPSNRQGAGRELGRYEIDQLRHEMMSHLNQMLINHAKRR